MDLIDTDVLIDVQRGHPPALTWFADQGDCYRTRRFTHAVLTVPPGKMPISAHQDTNPPLSARSTFVSFRHLQKSLENLAAVRVKLDPKLHSRWVERYSPFRNKNREETRPN